MSIIRRLLSSPSGGASVGLLVVGGLAVATVSSSLYNVDGGHAAIVFNRFVGVKETVYGEGTHFKFPWIERPEIYHVRAKPRVIPSLTGSKDLQMVNITLRVLSRPDVTYLPEIYRTLGKDFDDRVLPSIVNEVLKSVVAQFNASQLIVQRELVSKMIQVRLVERAAHFHILLDDVSITNLKFGPEYSQAVEAKQVAQQEAERAKFLVEKAIQDKLSTVVRAEGEAQSAKLLSETIKERPEFLQLRKIEAARDIAHMLAKSQNRIYLSSDSLLLNLATNNEQAGKRK